MTSSRLILGLMLAALPLSADDPPIPTSIYSRVAPDYQREIQADGQLEREYYAIAYGGRIDGTIWDQAQEKDQFPEMAGIIAQELAKQNYYFAADRGEADLMIVISWGRTKQFETLDMTDAWSVRVIEDIARVLGYTDELARFNDPAQFAGSDRFNDLLVEMKYSRYYVSVSAYDFQEMTREDRKAEPTPRWVTRYSIPTRGNDFMGPMAEITAKAGRFFGQESGRLIRKHATEVSIGEIEVTETDAAAPAAD